jgi:hypothetical protein
MRSTNPEASKFVIFSGVTYLVSASLIIPRNYHYHYYYYHHFNYR